ncbi:hypothetical protein LIER_13712 [Lithospermum erythrorhizon]|uniref:Reverse transcriptase Ty1/copia-type domain-containing protein n=1 Tax=Lithospermum erythrorhizon TaxID=34254 RepID=A0AAV3Q0L4_LITER
MEVKSAFLNGVVEGEVYDDEPKRFVNNSCPQHVYRLRKTLYGLNQAPRACTTEPEEYNVRHHFITKLVEDKVITFEYVSTEK